MIKENEIPNKIVERIKKLLALADSSNENEATVASEKAMQLLAQYNMGLDEFTSNEIEQESVDKYAIEMYGKNKSTTDSVLIAQVAKSCFCHVFHRQATKKMPHATIPGYEVSYIVASYVIVGKSTNRRSCVEMFGHLKNTIEAVADFNFETYKMEEDNPIHGKTWKKDFKMGCVRRICERLKEQSRQIVQQAENRTDIVVYDPYKVAMNEINTYYNKEGIRFSSGTKINQKNTSAYSKGYEAGASVRLDPQKSIR